MGLFDKFNKKKEQQPMNPTLCYKAREIVEKLGKEQLIDKHSFPAGQYYHNYVYEGYGLKIVKPDFTYNNRENVWVYYKREKVLTYDIYVPGEWERILNELHQSIGAIQNERKKEAQKLERMTSILKTIRRIPDNGRINIGNGISIAKYERWEGSYDQIFCGFNCSVYIDNQLVFESFDDYSYGSDGPKHKTYIPGPWEKYVSQYAEYAERVGNQRSQQEAQNAADDEIKKLRKLRGEN